MSRRRSSFCRPARQQGAVAVVFALMLLALLGFAGLVLDGGRLYVHRTELQNAADACALAAAQELPPSGALTAAQLALARDAGQTVAARHRADLHSLALQAANVTVAFAAAADAATWLSADTAATATPATRYARCTVAPAQVRTWLMQLFGVSSVAVEAAAAATRVASGNNCARPTACGTVASLVQ